MASKPKFETREQWLNAFALEAAPFFKAADCPIPKAVRISIGFPSTGARSKRIGECWGTVSSQDDHAEIFLRPSLATSERIADVLTHELIHASLGIAEGHGKNFKKCATALGLTGKMRATVAGPKWSEWALPILKKIGPMPGAPLSEMRTIGKKQTTRMIKCECDDCGLIFRTTRSNIEGRDLRCPDADCGGHVMVEG